MWRFNGYALTCPEGGIWGARSGGRPGNSPKVTYGPDGLSECLPEGLYLILRREFVEIKDEKGYYNDPGMYLPEKNEGWFVPLRPLFYTERGTPEKGRFGSIPMGKRPAPTAVSAYSPEITPSCSCCWYAGRSARIWR